MITLRTGMKGHAVEALQDMLSKLGYYKGNIDGSYGRETRAAVAAFQEAGHLLPTGVADERTLLSLAGKSAVVR